MYIETDLHNKLIKEKRRKELWKRQSKLQRKWY